MLADPAPIEGVIFDFHGTLVDAGDPDQWIQAALRRLGGTPPDVDATRLKTHLFDIWQHAHTVDPRSERDLDHARHRAVFGEAVALCPGVPPSLVDALYDVMPDQWLLFADALPVLRELRSRGVPVAVLSNIGMDIRDSLGRAGVLALVEGLVLSYEAGVVKPDPAIFARALDLIGLPGSRVLMVGDSPRDDVGGASLGIRTLILPRTAGPVHGLGAVLRLL